MIIYVVMIIPLILGNMGCTKVPFGADGSKDATLPKADRGEGITGGIFRA